jgi:hypothetical protein
MTKQQWLCGTTTCVLLTVGAVCGAQTTASPVTVPFSDPAKPGTVRISVLSGTVSVRAGSGRDVVVTTSPHERTNSAGRDRDRQRPPRDRDHDDQSAGLRRLTRPAGINVEEANNIVTVSASTQTDPVDVVVQVPPSASVVVHSVNGRDVSVEGVNGSIEVTSVNGSIRLTDVGGPVIAHATNGKLTATLRQVVPGAPMSFTSFNGNVDVTLPGSAKASVKLRSGRGDVYSDFDIQPSQTQPTPQAGGTRDDRQSRGRNSNSSGRDSRSGDPAYRLDVDRAIYGTINGGGADFELRTFNGNLYLRKGK